MAAFAACFFTALSLSAQNAAEGGGAPDKTGVIAAIGVFDYISAGLGFNKNTLFRNGAVLTGYNYGAIAEYKPPRELHLRAYGNLYGGLIGLYLGASAILATDFEDVSGGAAPEIGLGLHGFSVLYRYNFYFYKPEKFNCHEIALQIYPIFR